MPKLIRTSSLRTALVGVLATLLSTSMSTLWARRRAHGMANPLARLFTACLLALTPQLSGAVDVKQLTAEDYARAERFLFWNKDRYITGGEVRHHWIHPETVAAQILAPTNARSGLPAPVAQGKAGELADHFWYRRTNAQGAVEFVLVDAATGEGRPAFDHMHIAASLTKALGNAPDNPVLPDALPFTSFRYSARGQAIEFLLKDKLWTCGLQRDVCTNKVSPLLDPTVVVSPDGRWAAFRKDHNLWIRSLEDGAEFALTSDGVEHYSYAASTGNNTRTVSDQRSGRGPTPVVLWSPDSRRLLTNRVDERKVKELYLLQSVPDDGSLRPKPYSFRFSMANDEHKAQVHQFVFDVMTRERVDLKFPVFCAPFFTPIEIHDVWWSRDGREIEYIERGPFYRTLTLHVADARTGESRKLIEESGETFVELASPGRLPMVERLTSGEILWFSERDGWGHLYLYDQHGRSRQITKGEWLVRGIVGIDERSRTVYFTASGREPNRNPYYRHLYRVQLDGSGLELLTPENAEHQINIFGEDWFSLLGPDPLPREGETRGLAPSGKYFIDVYSRPDLPPTSVLRAIDGRLIATLETADISALEREGFTMPEPFEVLAADEQTKLYGTILRPSRFDPAKKYPVIDSIYPGPQIIRTFPTFSMTVFDPVAPSANALAELGFIVVTVDGRGTPHRSKAFYNASYGKLGDAGNLEDHIAALKQLAQRYPSMDLERVGIFGQSGGGYASTRAMLKHPDFYKVAVSGAGNHDQRGYLAFWGETYNGPDNGENYLAAANAPLAKNLQGKLLLIHGDMDDNVPPALTMQVVDGLIKANKDFDMLIVPNAGHGVMREAYATRRMWDYFVRHLMGAQPPAGYRIGSVVGSAE